MTTTTGNVKHLKRDAEICRNQQWSSSKGKTVSKKEQKQLASPAALHLV